MNETVNRQLAQLNQQLKANKLGVAIQKRKNRLYIRAVFPPQPGSKNTQYHQQAVATGYTAELASLRLARKMAEEIAAKLAGRTFDWKDYKDFPVELKTEKTTAQWISKFELNYFQKHLRTPKKELSWKVSYRQHLIKLPQEQPLTTQLLHQAIVLTEPDSSTRSGMCKAYALFGKFAGLNVEFVKPLKGSYSSAKPARRDLPSDEEIVLAIHQIPYPSWRWAAGMIATYGLRPHEVFHLDTSTLLWIDVGEETKTGWRRVPPLYPEWIKEFDLETPQVPRVTGLTNSDLGHSFSKAFRRYQVPFRPYDLRHAWAVRALLHNLPVSMAAKWMGHSVKIHTRTYQAWIDAVSEQEIFERAVNHALTLPA